MWQFPTRPKDPLLNAARAYFKPRGITDEATIRTLTKIIRLGPFLGDVPDKLGAIADLFVRHREKQHKKPNAKMRMRRNAKRRNANKEN